MIASANVQVYILFNALKKIKIERLFSYKFARLIVSIVIFNRAFFYKLIKKHYRSFADFCWIARVSDITPFKNIGIFFVNKSIEKICENGTNHIIKSFRKDKATKKYILKYSIASQNGQDIFRDIIVLKSPLKNEKGVILLKYAITFDAFIYFFNVEKLLDKYFFVLEPCWAGYYNSNILMWIFPKHNNNVFVQCYTKDDYELTKKLEPSLLACELGPADWVNTDEFKPLPVGNKCYDLVMVANWSLVKRHDILFRALNIIENRKINVLLIGFAWGGRTAEDIRNEASVIESDLINVEIKENLSHAEIVTHLSSSKIYVFLSEKEGDNKAIVEAMFTDVPAIVYQHTVGGASRRVNDMTGIFSSYEELHNNILYMFDNYSRFSPRQWAMTHTGSFNSTKKLNELIKQTALQEGEDYTVSIVEKVNAPNLAYKNNQDQGKFFHDYDYIMRCRV